MCAKAHEEGVAPKVLELPSMTARSRRHPRVLAVVVLEARERSPDPGRSVERDGAVRLGALTD